MKIIHTLLILMAFCFIPLILGMESILLVPLPGGLPLGTLLAAIGFVSASAIPVGQHKSGSLLSRMAFLLLLASILWLPIGIYLSGNAALSFVNDAADSQFFWRYTGILGVSIFILLMITVGKFILDRRAEKTNLMT